MDIIFVLISNLENDKDFEYIGLTKGQRQANVQKSLYFSLDSQLFSILSLYRYIIITEMAICSLETWIGNIVDWKHQNRFETHEVVWKQKSTLETCKLVSKQKNVDWKHRNRFETKNVLWKH